MIEPGVFRNEWAALVERFGLTSADKQPSRLMVRRYYEYLSPRMDTETFVRAARRVYAEREFFPRPADFLPDGKPTALDQWDLCQRVMRGDRGALERMSDEGRHVVRLLGGPQRLRQTPVDRADWVRRDFLGLYGDVAEAAERERHELTPAGRRLVRDAMMGRLEQGGEAA